MSNQQCAEFRAFGVVDLSVALAYSIENEMCWLINCSIMNAKSTIERERFFHVKKFNLLLEYSS